MNLLFSSRLNVVANRVRRALPECQYDHRPFIPQYAREAHPHIFDDLYRSGYACLKYVVADAIQPRSIVEIGVGFGVAARAFISACPDASYRGFDNGTLHSCALLHARDSIAGRFNADITLIDDSLTLAELPQCDLVHVDGCHLYDWAYHDTALALRAAEWVLIDDARDSQVAAAAFAAIYDWRAGDLEWCYFEDSWTGSILIHRESVTR